MAYVVMAFEVVDPRGHNYTGHNDVGHNYIVMTYMIMAFEVVPSQRP